MAYRTKYCALCKGTSYDGCGPWRLTTVHKLSTLFPHRTFWSGLYFYNIFTTKLWSKSSQNGRCDEYNGSQTWEDCHQRIVHIPRPKGMAPVPHTTTWKRHVSRRQATITILLERHYRCLHLSCVREYHSHVFCQVSTPPSTAKERFFRSGVSSTIAAKEKHSDIP